jgi:ADP-ribose pyrophosphatase YjhB (NUDIX family)
MAVKTHLRHVNLRNVRPARAGIIFYTEYQGRILYCFGKDTKTGELTDFGGGVKYKSRGEDAVDGALREFQEETLGIFVNIEKSVVIRHSKVLYNKETMIILVRMPRLATGGKLTPSSLARLFASKVDKHSEIEKIIWLTREQISKSSRIYPLIKPLLALL